MAQETVSIAWCDNGNVDGKFMYRCVKCAFKKK